MKAYRVEDPVLQHGLWRNFDGTVNSVFSKLTVGKCKDMPMDDSEFYRSDGKQWFSATDDPDKLKAWFDVLDVVEMERLGYGVYEFDVASSKMVSPFEIVFTRDSINSVRTINPESIWSDYGDVKKNRPHA